jgi:hypothetical protein
MHIRSRRVFEAALLVAASLATTSHARADDLEPYRERFRAGLEHYQAHQYAEAIVTWEGILRELGPKKGYRLAYNLGRAYEAFGSFTQAAERYQVFLAEVDEREANHVDLEPNVSKQAEEARERLADLVQSLARIRTVAEATASVVKVDDEEPRPAGFVAYVRPGKHTLLFRRGTSEVTVEAEVQKGEVREVVPRWTSDPTRPPTSPKPVRYEDQHPLSSTTLYVSGGISTLSVLVPVFLYSHALSIRDDYTNSVPGSARDGLAGDYDSARSRAYASVALPAVLFAATAGLVTYYFLGTKRVRVNGGDAAAAISF